MIMGITKTHLESVWNPSGPSEVPLLLKPVTGQELFSAVFYSKPALIKFFLKKSDINSKIVHLFSLIIVFNHQHASALK